MKRNSLIVLTLSLLFAVSTITVDATLADALQNTIHKGAMAKICLHVVDPAGHPVAGAKVWGGLQTGGNLGDFTPISGVTDTNGEYVIHGRCTNRIRCDITKDGYYRSEFLVTNYGYTHTVKDGMWRPFGLVTVITLRPITGLWKLMVPSGDVNNVGRWCIPVWDCWVGFDLQKFDWTPPYGNGVNDDMQVRFKANIKNQYFDFKIAMDVCFTNNPFAGAYVCTKNRGSDLTWSECADTNQIFSTEFNYVCERRPDGRRIKKTLSENSYMVFRTRTKVDDDGNLMSAHYGVISGEWVFGSETMRFGDACFNSTANDTLIEDGYFLRKVVQESKSPIR